MGQGALGTTQFEDHTKMRRLLAPAFSPKAVAGLLPRMQEIIGQGLEGWAAKGSIKALEESKLLSFKVALAPLSMLCKGNNPLFGQPLLCMGLVCRAGFYSDLQIADGCSEQFLLLPHICLTVLWG